MTAIPNSDPDPGADPDCLALVADLLDWLDDADVDPATVQTVLRLLADRRRRLAVEVVRAYEQELTLPDLAEMVAERETGDPIVDIPAEHVSEVYLSLYHDHLPRLVDTGLVAYDQERDLVTPAEF